MLWLLVLLLPCFCAFDEKTSDHYSAACGQARKQPSDMMMSSLQAFPVQATHATSTLKLAIFAEFDSRRCRDQGRVQDQTWFLTPLVLNPDPA